MPSTAQRKLFPIKLVKNQMKKKSVQIFKTRKENLTQNLV